MNQRIASFFVLMLLVSAIGQMAIWASSVNSIHTPLQSQEWFSIKFYPLASDDYHKVFQENMVFSVISSSKIECTMLCLLNIECQMVTFTRKSRSCTGHSTKRSDTITSVVDLDTVVLSVKKTCKYTVHGILSVSNFRRKLKGY